MIIIFCRIILRLIIVLIRGRIEKNETNYFMNGIVIVILPYLQDICIKSTRKVLYPSYQLNYLNFVQGEVSW